MSLMLCEKSDVEDIWSEEGVEGRFDDGMNGALTGPDNLRIDRFIVRASNDVAMYLRKRYKLVDFAGSGTPPDNTPDQVKYWTAVVAAYYCGTRRGLSVSKTLEDQYAQVMKWLVAISEGDMDLAEVNDSFDTTPCVSNFFVDGRYKNAKVRKALSTSTGLPPNESKRKTNLEAGPINYPFD